MTYETRPYPSHDTVTLQSIGHVIGRPATELKPGDVTMWNFGEQEEVVEITRETAAFRVVKIKTKSGYVGERKIKKSRLVVILDK